MRIGELLVESGLVGAKQLDEALDYAKAKALPLGRCLKILRYIEEENLNNALEAQQLLRKGVDPQAVLQALKSATSKKITLSQALGTQAGGASAFGASATVSVAGAKTTGTFTMPAAKSAIELISDGDKLFAEDNCSAAERSYMQAKDKLVIQHGLMHEEVAASMVKLANVYLATDRHDEAEPLYKQVLQIRVKLKGEDDPTVGRGFEDLGDLYAAKSDSVQAKETFESALAIVEKHPPVDILVIARLLNKLAKVWSVEESDREKRLGEYCTDSGLLSADKMQTALQRSKQTGKPMGSILRDDKLLTSEQIESVLFAQLLTKEKMLPYAMAVKALTYSNQAKMTLKQLCSEARIVQDSANDEQYRQLVLEQDKLLSTEQTKGADHADVAPIAKKLAGLHADRGNLQYAALLYKRALALFETAQNKQSTADVCDQMAKILIRQKNHMEAQPLLLKSLGFRQALGQAESASGAQCLQLLAEVEFAQQNFASALSFFKSALAVYDKAAPNRFEADLLKNMSACQLEVGLLDDADATYQRIVGWAQARYGLEPETADCMQDLGDWYVQRNKSDLAKAQYFQAMQIYQRHVGYEAKAAALAEKLK